MSLDPNKKKLNRRLVFRINEHADLFYQKIGPVRHGSERWAFGNVLGENADAVDEQPPSLEDRREQFLPHFPQSQIDKNDTLKVNISSSGIAFTCRERLEPGEYLSLRINLLPRMTVLTACGEVVYCMPANPYEFGDHPYSVGARFVNLTTT